MKVRRKPQEVDVSKLNASFWTDPEQGDFGMFTKAGNRRVATVIKAAYSMSEKSDEDVARFVHKELNKIEKKHSEVHDTVVREGIVAALERSWPFNDELCYLETVDSRIASGEDRATAEAFAGQIKLYCEKMRESKLQEKRAEANSLGKMIDAYMRVRAEEEGVGYELTPNFFEERIVAGVGKFFGVTFAEGKLLGDDQQPAFFAKWNRKH